MVTSRKDPLMTTAAKRLRECRDELISLRETYDAAYARFQWPDVGDSFNFAHDWFDNFARGNSSPGLVIVEEDGTRGSYTFDQLARRSDQVAGLLAEHGIGKGDSVIVMLGNQVELWETMLAIIKLGAVIMPTTTALGARDLSARIERGNARGAVCAAGDTSKFTDLPDGFAKIAVGDGVDGWVNFADAYSRPETQVSHPGNGTDDRVLLYFTSGTTSRPKLVEHTHRSYPVGHLTTMYWLGLRPGDVHLNVSSPGWAKHAWSNFFAPWLAEATVFL